MILESKMINFSEKILSDFNEGVLPDVFSRNFPKNYTSNLHGKWNDLFSGEGTTKTQKSSKNVYDGTVLNTLLKHSDIEKHGLCIISDSNSKFWITDKAKEFNNSWELDLVERINELRDIASEEDLPILEDSVAGALSFSKKINSSTYPSVFLIGNGNIRFLWNKGDDQIGIQFLDRNNCQYILFSKDDHSSYRHMGTSNQNDLVKIIKVLSLDILMNS